MWSLVMWIATFRLHTVSLHQAMRSTDYASPYKSRYSTAAIGAFRSSLFRGIVPVAVRCRTVLLLLFLDCGHPCFWNFYSTVPVDFVRVKSYVNRLFDPVSVTMGITINKLYFIPNREVSGVVGVL